MKKSVTFREQVKPADIADTIRFLLTSMLSFWRIKLSVHNTILVYDSLVNVAKLLLPSRH